MNRRARGATLGTLALLSWPYVLSAMSPTPLAERADDVSAPESTNLSSLQSVTQQVIQAIAGPVDTVSAITACTGGYTGPGCLTPTPVPTRTPTPIPTPTPTRSPTPTASPTPVRTATPTPTPAGCTNNPPTAYGQASFTVNVEVASTYVIWVRLKAPDANNNSVYVQADGNCAVVYGDTGLTAGEWKWIQYYGGSQSNVYSVNLGTGSHQIILTGKEPGVMVDRIILTNDTACTPATASATCGVIATPTATPTQTPTASPSAIPTITPTPRLSSPTPTPLVTPTPTPAPTATPRLTASPTPTPMVAVPGDVNLDGIVNINDLSALLLGWNNTPNLQDFNNDGRVDVYDLSILLTNWHY